MARRDDDRPVLTGLVALVGVGLVVGLLVAGAALAVTQVLGLGDETASTSAAAATEVGSGESMYLPSPQPTETDTAPAITLAPVPGAGSDVPTAAPPATTIAPAAPAISLSSPVTTAGPMQEIPMSGSYPGGDGATLQIERSTDATTWSEFPVDVRVEAGTFSTVIRTSQTGETRFRVRDTTSGLTSNEIVVSIG